MNKSKTIYLEIRNKMHVFLIVALVATSSYTISRDIQKNICDEGLVQITKPSDKTTETSCVTPSMVGSFKRLGWQVVSLDSEEDASFNANENIAQQFSSKKNTGEVSETVEETTNNLKTNEKLVIDALTEMFDKQNTDLIDVYYHPDYIQHSPQIKDGREGIREAVNGLKAANITINREIARVVAEGDLVGVQARVSFNGEGSAIVGDIFRIQDGQIIEHWDVQQEETPKEETANGNSMIDGGGDADKAMSLAELERNRKTVEDFLIKGFGGDIELLKSLFGDEYIQHNPQVPNGKEVVIGFLDNGGFPAEVKQIVAQGDLVFAFVHYPDFNNAVIDIFRLDNKGKVVEHWDIAQQIPEEMAHDNGMF